jgi:uncharacterized membrane protein YphA (DoxX/SURF4 family)
MARITTHGQQSWAGENDTDFEAAADNEVIEPSERNALLRFLTNPYLTLISRFVLGSIFVLSGLSKLTAPSAFADSIRSYEIPMPDVVVNTMATVLPIVELGLGMWILAGLFTRFAASIIAGLVAVFMVAIGQAWARGIEADCGCFAGAEGTTSFAQGVMNALGPVGKFLSDEQIGPIPLLRDVLFLVLAVHLILVPTVFALDQLRNRQRINDEPLPAE